MWSIPLYAGGGQEKTRATGDLRCARPTVGGRRREQRLDACDLGRGGPVARSDHALDDPSLAIDEEALGIAPDAELPADVALRVEQHGEGHLHLVHERLD